MKVSPIRTPEGILTPSWRRAAKALVRRIRDAESYYADLLPTSWPRRKLIQSIHVKDLRGTCKFCKLPTDRRRQMWHKECVVAYKLACGDHAIFWEVRNPNNPDDPGECAVCGIKKAVWEIDHVVPLGVAARRYQLGLRRYWWRAWWVENLQYLCRDCHLDKTRLDRQLMRDLDNGVERLPFTE